MLALTYIVNYTKIGKAMRAVSFDADAARLMGINIDRVISMTFALGSALLLLAAYWLGSIIIRLILSWGWRPASRLSWRLSLVGLESSRCHGGRHHPRHCRSLVSGFISSTFRDAAAFAILILILLYKPQGLFGKNIREKV